MYEKAIELQPDYAPAYNNIGLIYAEKGKLDEALEMYEKAIALQSDYAPAYNNIGLVYKEKGNLNAAVRYYKKSIKFGSAIAYSNLADIYDLLGKYKQAIKLYYKCLSIDSDYARAYTNLGYSLKQNKFFDEAILILEAGLRISETALSYYNLAYAYYAKNNVLKYIENLKKRNRFIIWR